MMLEVEGLSVWHGRVQAVRRVSLAVEQGETVALLGANGAGKSSLLAAIAGLIRPAEGSVSFAGEGLAGFTADRVARHGLALVPEGRQLAGTMPVRDNLLLGAYQHFRRGDLMAPLPLIRKRESLQARMEEVFALFPRLRERQEQAAHSLSGGEQQMLAIGCALMSSPRALMLDEPSVGLAPELVRGILSLVEELRQRGLAILLVEQDAHGALRVAQRGYVMETGRIVAEGAASDLLGSESLRRAYLGM